jgi:tetratricopeptide (TPR) repeat protein
MSTTRDGHAYVTRREEAVLRDNVTKLRHDNTSRALLVYGAGGVGKSTLVHRVATTGADTDVVWVPPIDVDDSEYWLLSNLERAIADALDPRREYFGPYFDHLFRLPRYAERKVGYDAVLTHLGRINDTFVECYRTFVERTGRKVVVTLDTIEAIRGMYLLLTLTQWMKRLPSTLFILAGRPLSRRERTEDPIREELSDPHLPLEFSELELKGFDDDEAGRFLSSTPLHGSLTDGERRRLIALTEGQPLWLALAVEYLQVADLPVEMTPEPGEEEPPREEFRRRLMTLYRSNQFWPEAIKRLAVVRHSVSYHVWRRLMDDLALPPDVTDWEEAWQQLLRRPWVRPRANARYVTLHDALAEELAQRLIPLHDREEIWRRAQWHRAKEIYAGITAGADSRVREELAELSNALQTSDAEQRDQLVRMVAELDAEKRELDQLLTAQLHYSILDDFQAGTDLFLAFHRQASDRRDPLFMELICHEVERFLPRGETSEPLEDVLDVVLPRFQQWLAEHPERHIEIALRIAGFLIQSEQPGPAVELLDSLPDDPGLDPMLRYQVANERGNACMRIPGMVGAAAAHFRSALEQARRLTEPESILTEAQAQKELGFYYRNIGRWKDADETYRIARDVLSRLMGPGSPPHYRGEMASIQANWAYLKALRGNYREARNLIDSSIAVRRRLKQRHGEGVSLSISGEVYRYDGNFVRAWGEYQSAELIFHELKSWPWLGLLYQEQAICLHQASREGVRIVELQERLARELIRQSLDICRESAVRFYPSALNRAGRIFAVTDIDAGLRRLGEGIDEAKRIGDGWFFSANLIEYLELNYRAWTSTSEAAYRRAIADRAETVEEAIAVYGFPDLRARWQLLQGHLLLHDALAGAGQDGLNRALEHYSAGFHMLADDRVGSHGSAAIGREFVRFRELFEQLPEATRRSWYEQLRTDWSTEETAAPSTALLARLEELY